MGKARRARSKFHISSVQGDFKSSPSETEFSIQNDTGISSDFTNISLGTDVNNKNDQDSHWERSGKETVSGDWKVVPEDDLFKNVDIDVDKLETSVQNSIESRPVNISISKCIKRSVVESKSNLQLKKGDKRELRRNLFIKKIDAIHEIMKKKPKKSKTSAEVNGQKQIYEILSDKTFKQTNKPPEPLRLKTQSSNMKISKRKQKAMSKLKNKSQEMLKNINFYNQIISDSKYQADAMGVIANAVQKKVYADL